MFSIRFGPKLIEVKTLISDFCAALKSHTVKRNRVIWEELSINEGFRENEKKVGLGFFRVQILSAISCPLYTLTDHWIVAPRVFIQGGSMYIALFVCFNIFWV